MEKDAVRKQVHAALEREHRINLHRYPVRIGSTDGSQSHLRFAGALAWWTPGRRDVINALEVRPAYEDRDDEVTEVMHLVLEADPKLDSDLIRAGCAGKVVTLEGSVPSELQKRRAELDAWSLFAIRGVVNRLQVG